LVIHYSLQGRLRCFSCTQLIAIYSDPKPAQDRPTRGLEDRCQNMSGLYNHNANTAFMSRREVRSGTRSATTTTATAASVHAVYAINQDIEYLASAAFDNFDINQIVESGPLPWDPADMNVYHTQSVSPALPSEEVLPIRSPPASESIPFKQSNTSFFSIPLSSVISSSSHYQQRRHPLASIAYIACLFNPPMAISCMMPANASHGRSTMEIVAGKNHGMVFRYELST
jgi:hypothetical protein